MMNKNNPKIELYPAAMTIAGSDSSGGAGIEADLRTFNAYGVYSCAALTAVTSQNPAEVRRIDPIPAPGVRCQIETVLDLIPVRAVKSGMLFNAEIVETVAETVKQHKLKLVCDPVMVSTSGTILLENDAIAKIRDLLLPEATWITPNLPEAEMLLGHDIETPKQFADAAKECFDRWGVSVLLKTGHALSGKTVTDFVCKEGKIYTLSAPRISEEGASHGTGCTLSAAMAAGIALGMPWKQMLCEAKAFVTGSLRESVPLASNLKAMYPPVEDYLSMVRLEKH